MEKKLYILKPKENLENSPWEPWYDKAFGFVVRAKDSNEARKIASENAGGEHSGAWGSKYSTCKELSVKGKSELIIRDFASA